jgi:hypothetical protein
MSPAAREYFAVDLRGLRAPLVARADRDGLTASDVTRSALVVALSDESIPMSVGSRPIEMPPAAIIADALHSSRDPNDNGSRWV